MLFISFSFSKKIQKSCQKCSEKKIHDSSQWEQGQAQSSILLKKKEMILFVKAFRKVIFFLLKNKIWSFSFEITKKQNRYQACRESSDYMD